MRKNSIKNTRINSEVMKELSVLIRDSIKDPRVSPLTSVTDVEVTPDLQYCKVYISALGGAENMDKTIQGLKAASSFLRRELAKTVNLRHTPELQFVPDNSLAYGAHMDALLKQVAEQDKEKRRNYGQEDVE